MATTKQRRAVKNMAENGGNVSKAMRDAGYTDITAATPKKLTTSKNFAELCDELGLTSDFLVSTLVDDIKALEPKDRLGQLTLGTKMRGLVTEKVETEQVVNVTYRPSKLPAGFDELDASTN